MTSNFMHIFRFLQCNVAGHIIEVKFPGAEFPSRHHNRINNILEKFQRRVAWCQIPRPVLKTKLNVHFTCR